MVEKQLTREHAMIRSVLGEHVKQAGSLVAPDRCRFDFTHYTALSEREKERIEELVNERIVENHPVAVAEMDIDQAIAAGSMALFDEKYGDKVRVVTVQDVSKELCGGTHASASGDIGLFKIVSEGGISAGVRRLEILAGRRAYQAVRQEEQSLKEIAQLMKASDPDVVGRVERMLGQLRDTEATSRSHALPPSHPNAQFLRVLPICTRSYRLSSLTIALAAATVRKSFRKPFSGESRP